MRGGEKSRKSCSLLLKHLAVLNGGEPEAVGVGVVVASSPTVTLDERGAAEFFQAGTWRGQCLTRTLSTSAGVLKLREKELREKEYSDV